MQGQDLIHNHELAKDHVTEIKAVITDTNNDMDNEQESTMEIRENENGLDSLFIQQLKNMKHITMLQSELRKKLCKLKLLSDIEESSNRLLGQHLYKRETIPETADIVMQWVRQSR